MTDYAYDDDTLVEGESEEQTVGLNRDRIRSLERDAKAKRKTDEENATLKRELAFVKAGINPDDPKLKYFVKGYEGEVTPEAIRAAAEADGFLTATGTDEQEAAAHERISNASAGATSQPNTDPIQELRDADRTGGKEAVLATIRKHGHNII